ncbi:MAG: calcium-binding protein [Boseongicola sp. SB0673_bin_14]|nr:calcium-binding protein [Boseongicola sp. SB0673_bin_14]
MKLARLTILAAASLIAAGTGAALALEAAKVRMTFEQMDVDGSGEITREDLEMLPGARFAEMDTDGSGDISEAEFVAAAQARAGEAAARMFARLDADGDGVLSQDALAARRHDGGQLRGIMRLDSDDSGGVSAEEFEAGMERFGHRHRDHRRGEGRGWWGFWRN